MKMKITQNPSPNRSIGRQGHIPDFIVCHITEGAFNGTVAWITKPAAQVSYHFVVARDGRVSQAVDVENMAWANGTRNDGGNMCNSHSTIAAIRERRVNANLYSVSIGFEGIHAQTQGALTEAQTSAGAELMRHIRDEIKRLYGFEIPLARTNIIGHNEVTPRTRPHCPGERFPFDEFVRRTNASQTQASAWAQEAWDWAVCESITDGTRPRDNITREEAVTMLHRYYRNAAR